MNVQYGLQNLFDVRFTYENRFAKLIIIIRIALQSFLDQL